MNAIMRIEVRVLTREGIAQLRDLQAAMRGVAASGALAGGASAAAFGGSQVSLLGRWGAALETNGLALTKWGKNMQWTGRQLTTAFTLPLLIAGGVAVDMGLKLEAGIAKVQQALAGGGLSGAKLKTEVDLLQRAFIALSDTYGVNIKDTEAIGAEWAAAGDRGADLAKSVELTMQVMILGSLSYDAATKFLIALRTQYGLTADEAVAAIATIAAADQASGATFADMADAFSRTGGEAARAGLTIQQTVASIAALTPSMGSAYRAGIALQTILVRIQSPTAAAAKVLKEIGVAIGPNSDFNKSNAEGKLLLVANAIKNLNDQQKTTVVSDIFSKLQTPRALELLQEMIDKQSEYKKVLNATADAQQNANKAQAQISTLLSSDPQALKIVWAQLQNSLAQIGIVLIPVLLNAAKGAVAFVGMFDNLSGSTKKWILALLGVLLIIGPIVRYVGALATLGGVAFRALGTLFGALGSTSMTQVEMLQAEIAKLEQVVFANKNAQGEIVGTAAVAEEQMTMLMGRLEALQAQATVAAAKNGDLQAQGTLAAIEALDTQSAALSAALSESEARYLADNEAQGVWLTNFIANWGLAVEAATTASAEIQAQMDLMSFRSLAPAFANAEVVTSTAFTGMMTDAQAAAVGSAAAWNGALADIETATTAVAGASAAEWQASAAAIVAAGGESATGIAGAMFTAAGLVDEAAIESALAWNVAMAETVAASDAAAVEIAAAFEATAATLAVTGTETGLAFVLGIEGGIELGAAAIPVLIAVAIAAAVLLFWKFRDDITQVFTYIGSWVAGVFESLPGIVASAFTAVINVVAAAAKAIYSWLSYLNPFAKHSPSLIDQVRDGTKEIGDQYENLHKRMHGFTGPKKSATDHENPLSVLNPYTKHSPSLVESVEAGMDAIAKKYASLKNLGTIFAGSDAALLKFKNDLQGVSNELDLAALEAEKTKILKFAPQAAGDVDMLIARIMQLEAQLPALGAAFSAEEAVVARWASRLDVVNNSLQIQQDRLTILTDTANKYKTAIDKNSADLQTILSTPIQGQKAMGDQIFANDMAQKQLNLDMLKIADSVGVTGSVTDQLAKLNGQMTLLRGKREELRQAGAGSDVLGGIDQQISSTGQQSTGLVAAAARVAVLQLALDKLQQTGSELNLEQSLKFDPLTRELTQVANGMRELPFTELLDKATKIRVSNDALTISYNHANDQVREQAAVVAGLTAQRDKLQLNYDIENQKLTALGTAYDNVTQQIQAMTQALSDLISKQATAKSGSGVLGAGAGGPTTPPVTNFPVPPDNTKALQDYVNKLEEQMKKSFGSMKFPNPFTAAWDGIKHGVGDLIDWLAHNLPRINLAITTLGVSEVVLHFGTIVDFFKLLPGRISSALAPGWQAFSDTFVGLGGVVVRGFLHGLDVAWQKVSQWFAGLIPRIGGDVGDMSGTLSLGSTQIAGGFADALRAAWGVVKDFFTNVAADIFGDVGDLTGTLAQDGTDLIGGIWKGITDGWGDVENFFKDIDKTITDAVGSLTSTLVHDGVAVVSGLWTGITSGWGKVTSFFTGMGSKIVAYVGSLTGTLVHDGGALLYGLWQGVTSGWGTVASFFHNLGPGIVDAVGSLLTTLTHAGGALIVGFWNGVKGAAGGVAGALGGIFSGVAGVMKTFVNDVITGLNFLISALDKIHIHVPSINILGIHTPGFDLGFKIPPIPLWGGAGGTNGSGTPQRGQPFALGGIVPPTPGGIQATIGEAGRREAVIPLPPGLDLNVLVGLMRSVERTQTQFITAVAGTVNMSRQTHAAPAGSTTSSSKTNNFYGPLVFPNVENGDDAEAFIKNLESIS